MAGILVILIACGSLAIVFIAALLLVRPMPSEVGAEVQRACWSIEGRSSQAEGLELPTYPDC